MKKTSLITNCVHYKRTGGDAMVEILIEDGRIAEVALAGTHSAEDILDAKGRIVAPGLVDVHIQGAGGCDVLDNTPEALVQISKTLAQCGTTAFLGTSVVRPTTENAHLRLMRDSVGKDLGGAQLIGIHLEGPYINMKKKGGIDSGSIYGEDSGTLEDVLKHTGPALKMMTIAPELPGHHRIIKQLIDAGVVPSFGHSEATYEEAKQAFDLGVPHATHLFNAMLPLNHRTPGPIAAIFESNHVSAQIIADGHHVHPAMVALAWRNLGRERSICITDGVQGIGLPAGHYFYNGREYDTSSGAARYLDGTLIGATIGLSAIVSNFSRFAGCSFADAVDSASANPARLLGMEKNLGSIESGRQADLILLNEDLSLYATLVKGNVVYRAA